MSLGCGHTGQTAQAPRLAPGHLPVMVARLLRGPVLPHGGTEDLGGVGRTWAPGTPTSAALASSCHFCRGCNQRPLSFRPSRRTSEAAPGVPLP